MQSSAHHEVRDSSASAEQGGSKRNYAVYLSNTVFFNKPLIGSAKTPSHAYWATTPIIRND